MTSDLRQHDLETLSALFDGELKGDAARFALKRLEHDVEWRGAVERWQLAGDILRGNAPALVPSDFAARVSAAVAPEAAAAAPGKGRKGGRWIGGTALAASLVAAVVFMAQRAPEVPGAGNAAQSRVAAAPAAAVSPPPPAVESAPVRPIPAKAIAVTAAQRPTQATSRRLAAPRVETPAAVAAATPVASAGVSPRPGDPFTPPEPPASRPWPRAVLPQYGVGSGLTAGFGASPSLHPFEPRMPPDAVQRRGDDGSPR